MKPTTKFIYFGFASLALGCFTLSPTAQAVLPAPDGGYGPPDYGVGNTAEGENALLGLAGGTYNTAVGWSSLESVTTGSLNTGVGAGTLALDTADRNTAIGAGALLNNTTGPSNTATGAIALYSNTTGESNTANGAYALASNTTADFNTATGASALTNNTTGRFNTAIGANTLQTSTTADLNTAIGGQALQYNTTGGENTGVGFQALVNTSSGSANTAVGRTALIHNTTGNHNIALGYAAGNNLNTGDNNIDIGSAGVAGESNTIRIGSPQTRTFIKGISGVAVAGATVVVNAAGQLGVAASSAHFKHEIRPMDKESEAILALKPVSFCYDQDIDEQGLAQFGLVAEEVEKVNPDLVVRDTEGKPYSVRYDQVNAMLLNEFLKEHKAFVEEQHKVETLEGTVANLMATVKGQASQIQKVSAQLELSKAAPHTVLNNH
jgi:hypothetical protein